MDTQRPTPRVLTHDELKAAEAAFGGRPFNPAWSTSARKVYDGLVQVLPQSAEAMMDGTSSVTDSTVDEVTQPAANEESGETTISPSSLQNHIEEAPSSGTTLAKREEGIRSGVLIDVTEDAKKIGLTFPVTISKPLWEVGIAPSQALSDQERSERLRDVLMAFRLRLANQATLSPLIDFPAMLALPPGSIPQPVPLFALIQPDEHNRALVTLLLPNEVSASIVPLN
jgi:hypothetical protein